MQIFLGHIGVNIMDKKNLFTEKEWEVLLAMALNDGDCVLQGIGKTAIRQNFELLVQSFPQAPVGEKIQHIKLASADLPEAVVSIPSQRMNQIEYTKTWLLYILECKSFSQDPEGFLADDEAQILVNMGYLETDTENGIRASQLAYHTLRFLS